MDTQVLEDLGLTNAEIKVYLALLELGSTSAGAILDKTGLHNSVVHMTLNRLIDKGFVSYFMEGKRAYYQSADPRHIIDYINEKKERFEKILPELAMKREKAGIKPDVETYRGIKGIRALLYELLDAGSGDHHTIGSPGESAMMGDAFWLAYHKKRKARHIKAKLMFNESLREWIRKIKATGHYPAAEIRFLKEGFEPLTETIIRNDRVGIILWTEKPTGILIHNMQLAQSYEKYFQLLWERAKR